MHTWGAMSLPFLADRRHWFREQAFAYWAEAETLLPLEGKDEVAKLRYDFLKGCGDGMAEAYWEKDDQIKITFMRMGLKPVLN